VWGLVSVLLVFVVSWGVIYLIGGIAEWLSDRESNDIEEELARTGHWVDDSSFIGPQESRAMRMKVINEERAKLGQRPLR